MAVIVGCDVLYLRNEKLDYLLNVMHCLVFVCDVMTAALMMLMLMLMLMLMFFFCPLYR